MSIGASEQIALGPRAEKPWAHEEGEGGVDLTRQPTMQELDRDMALRSFTLSRSSLEPLRGADRVDGGERSLKQLTMKDIRGAGKPGGSDIVARASTAASFEDRIYSLGLLEETRKSCGVDPLLLDYERCALGWREEREWLRMRIVG